MPDHRSAAAKRILLLLVLSFMSFACSCSRSERVSDVDRLGSVAQGMSLPAVEDALGTEHRLQFHVLVAAVDCLCLSYAFGRSYDVLYFVFKDGVLDRIAEPPPFEERLIDYPGTGTDGKGSKISIRASVDPWTRMDLVLASPDLSGPAATASVQRRCPEERMSMSIIPAVIIAAPLLPFLYLGTANEYRINARTQERYDAQKVRLGSSIQDVLGQFGAPVRSGEVNGLLVDTFGVDNHLSLIDPSDVAPFFDVICDKFGKVRAVFSDDFHPRSR